MSAAAAPFVDEESIFLASEFGLDNFNHQHPASFNDKTDPVSAENWILDIGELFKVLGCTNEQRVMYAAYKLSGEVKRWWISRSALLKQELQGAPITWESGLGWVLGFHALIGFGTT
ncbi:hypothetical protein CJ030_MR7G009284 [Morella rubra]|uniref:Retrotransposon gag domain-containing protein n=1 Tax=Morella rubra TaxID=262757 RepID=A0A6A1V078_9ROSI|nr:hypothetical protein CJ030_MR7G009284 [Morella rubra]